jgi:hypothetical protein
MRTVAYDETTHDAEGVCVISLRLVAHRPRGSAGYSWTAGDRRQAHPKLDLAA